MNEVIGMCRGFCTFTSCSYGSIVPVLILAVSELVSVAQLTEQDTKNKAMIIKDHKLDSPRSLLRPRLIQTRTYRSLNNRV